MDEAEDYKGDDCFVEYITGPVEPYRKGDVLQLNDGCAYLVIGSQSLGEEQEHQAKDGGLCYEYRGDSYLRILKRLTWVV